MKKPSRMTRTAWIIAAGALGAALSGPAEAATQAGVSAAVRGQVEVYAIDDDTGRQAVGGDDIFLGDEISSYEDAGMQLMLLDETVFTIGADTDITIDDFVYDPATGAGEVVASVTKGVFRFVTGNIAQGDPEDMTVDLPVGTIGIRGTIGMAHFIDGHWVIVLLGPGVGNNANERAGALSVSAQGQTVDLTRARYGTIIEPGLPPAPPFLFSAAQIAAILGALGSPPSKQTPGDQSKGGTATKAAGQGTAQGRVLAAFLNALGGFSDAFGDTVCTTCTPDADIENLGNGNGGGGGGGGGPILDGFSTFEQLRTITTGTFQYDFSGTFVQLLQGGSPTVVPGIFTAAWQIDFGNKTAGGSSIFIDTFSFGGDISLSEPLFKAGVAGQVDYTALSGDAINIFAPSNFFNSNLDQSNASINNFNGVIANSATLDVTFDDGGLTFGIGGAES